MYFEGRVTRLLGRPADLPLSSMQTCPRSKPHTGPIVCTGVRGEKDFLQSSSILRNLFVSIPFERNTAECLTN